MRKLTHAQAKTSSAWHQKASADEAGRRWPSSRASSSFLLKRFSVPTDTENRFKCLKERSEDIIQKREHAEKAHQDEARTKEGSKRSRIPAVPHVRRLGPSTTRKGSFRHPTNLSSLDPCESNKCIEPLRSVCESHFDSILKTDRRGDPKLN